MKLCTKCKIEKELSEFNKNKNTKDGLSYYCKSCRKIWKIDNIDKIKKQEAIWKISNKDRVKQNVKNWVKENPEKIRANARRWAKNNPDKVAANNIMRRAKKLNQTPNLTKEEKQRINNIYKESQELTESTGIQHDVHHVIFLKNGGLHHPDNLRVLTRKEHIEIHKDRYVDCF